MTIADDDDWAKSVFTETELGKLRQAMKDIVAATEAELEVDSTYVEYDLSVRMDGIKDVIRWCRELHQENDVPPAVSDFLFAVGCAIGISYISDDTWEYDEELSDHATYFGSRDWFVQYLDDMEDDDDDE